jgi:DNA-binding NarL/FixJ family response regulator
VENETDPFGGRLRILVVDDQEVVTWGLRSQLTRHHWVGRCLQATDGPSALELARRYRPHVALVDLALGIESGAELSRRIRAEVPSTQVLLMSSGASVAPRAIEAAGACGFVSKQWKVDEIVAAIRIVGRGMRLQMRPSPAPGERAAITLTHREEQVLSLIASGQTNQQIASELGLSLYTVKQHAHAAYRKLEARNRTDAVLRAQRLGLIM